MSKEVESIDIELLKLARDKELTDDTIIEIQKIIDKNERTSMIYVCIAVVLSMIFTIMMVD